MVLVLKGLMLFFFELIINLGVLDIPLDPCPEAVFSYLLTELTVGYRYNYFLVRDVFDYCAITARS